MYSRVEDDLLGSNSEVCSARLVGWTKRRGAIRGYEARIPYRSTSRLSRFLGDVS